MQFDSFAEFVAMGGHALYVWLAYGATLAILIGSPVALMLAKKRQVSQLRWSLQTDRDGMHRTNRAETQSDTGVEYSAEKL
ncbi:MAG: heme exporter protein CcmD [bacterium]